MSLHPIKALDHVLDEYRDYLRTEFRAKDPALRAALEQELDSQFQPDAHVYARRRRWRVIGLDAASPWNFRSQEPTWSYRLCNTCELRYNADQPRCPRCLPTISPASWRGRRTATPCGTWFKSIHLVAKRTIEHLDHADCETACYRCLKAYNNQRFHEHLNWRCCTCYPAPGGTVLMTNPWNCGPARRSASRQASGTIWSTPGRSRSSA